ncbi:MAG: DUF1439 domain-containing protein [Burkholderiales bacterium]|nr:DUF1439 domain-containing protein [Burkholderiales bacterium]
MWAVAAAFLLSACAGLLGPREVEIPLSALQASLERRFPLNNRFLEIFDIRVTSPRLALQPDTGRVTTTLDAAIAPPFLRNAWRGKLVFSGVLSIDPARRAVVLFDPRVENVDFDGVDPAYSRQVTRIGSLLAEQIIRDIPLYTFQPENFRYAGVNFLPTKINTKPNALVVTFEPAK